MDIQEIIAELKSETHRLDQAIAALERIGSFPGATKRSRTKIEILDSTDGQHVDERRSKRSEAMKKSWADRRKKY